MKDFIYSGSEELRLMEVMNNYNYSISENIKKYFSNTEQKILDFGSGIGTIADFFDKQKIICLEIDENQRKILTDKNFEVIESLDQIKEESIANLYSSNVLEHIEDDYGIVKDIYKKMKKDGKIVFYVPAFQILYSQMDKNVGHYRRYNKKRMTKILKEAGFKIDKIFYADSLGFLVTLLFKLIGNSNGKPNKSILKIYDQFIFPISKFLDNILLKIFFGKNLVVFAKK